MDMFRSELTAPSISIYSGGSSQPSKFANRKCSSIDRGGINKSVSRSYNYTTLRIISVDPNGRILICVQRSDEADIEEEGLAADFEDMDTTEATYLFAGPQATDVTEIETVINTEALSQKLYLFGNVFYKLTLEK